MKSVYQTLELNMEQVRKSRQDDTEKYNIYSAKYRRNIENSESSSSPIRLRGMEWSPEKQVTYFSGKKKSMKRKCSDGFYGMMGKWDNGEEQEAGSQMNEIKLFRDIENEGQNVPMNRLRIVPDGYTSPMRQKNYVQQQSASPFLKKIRLLNQARACKQIICEKQPNQNTNQLLRKTTSLTDTISTKHQFLNCRITQSYVDSSTTDSCANIIVEQSVIFQRSILDSFLILSETQVKGTNYSQMIAIQKDIGLAVSLKRINCQRTEISNEINIMRMISENSVHVIKHYNGVVQKNDYIFIREYYQTLLRDMLDKINEQTIKQLCKQMLSVFQYFTSIKLIYKGNFLTNVCYHAGLYKLRNFQLCSIKKQTSQSSLRRKYLNVLRQMMKLVLSIDSIKPYYSNRLNRDLKPQTIVFMNDLIKNGMGFKELKQHTFLNN